METTLNADNLSSAVHWVRICTVEDIPLLGSRVVERASGNIAIFRTADGNVFALLDKCPHKGGPLSQGIVAGESVTCPLHSWNIGLSTGEAKLLATFLQRPTRILAREQICGDPDLSPLDRSIDVRISRLRRKIETDPHNPKMIRTVYGAGYLFASEVSWN